jgi:phosphoribosylamine--glycine ligase
MVIMAVRKPIRAHARAASHPAWPPPTTTTSHSLCIDTIVSGQTHLKILLIGSGGREHALGWRLKSSPSVQEVHAAPGNPGLGTLATLHSDRDYVELARSVAADLTVVGPEAPLVAGIVDRFRAEKMPIVGPTGENARLEGSKVHSKIFMQKLGIPTARFAPVATKHEALDALKVFRLPVVLKTDGLAAGKGVIIATTPAEARAAIQTLPCPLVIEEYLEGEEVSFIALCDGRTAVPLEPSQDHKRVFDNDEGPNTGGMGAYSDSLLLTEAERLRILETIVNPAVRATGFTGFLYAGLMMTPEGPSVLEFNVRMGDPETQPLMMRLESDWGEALMAAAQGTLRPEHLQWSAEPAACVVLASHGYPGEYATGLKITGIEDVNNAQVFQAGTRHSLEGDLLTAGGRVLGVTARGANLKAALDNAYAAVGRIGFEGMQYRKDIGFRGLKRYNDVTGT